MIPQPITKNLRTLPPNGAELADAEQHRLAPSQATSQLAATDNRRKPLELQLVWDGQMPHTANACNGCGRCRTQSPDARMCPIFRLAPSEEASPRAKANLMRAVIAGQLDPQALAKDELKDIADLCVNCHQCRLECPAGVDIPKLMIEAKAQYVATNGLGTADWVLTRLDSIARWSSRLAPLANWVLRTRWTRWLLEKTVGIAQGRKLPHVASSSFLRRAERRRLTRPTRRTGGKVLYFVDLYANWYDVQLADALVAVMEHNNIAVYVHPEQQPSGMNRISVGDVERARVVAARNVRLLAEAVRQGYEIVCTEPTAALCLTREYPDLLDDDDARLVASSHARSLHLSLAAARGRQAGARLSAAEPHARLSPAVPSAGAGGRLARRKSAAADSRRDRAADRTRLQRHGRHVWPQTRELPRQPPRRLGIDPCACAIRRFSSGQPSAARVKCRWSKARPSRRSIRSKSWQWPMA